MVRTSSEASQRTRLRVRGRDSGGGTGAVGGGSPRPSIEGSSGARDPIGLITELSVVSGGRIGFFTASTGQRRAKGRSA